MSAPQPETFIFPLGTVLFPEGVLPLKIFEQRYLDMTKACLRESAPFGVCLIREGQEVGAPAVPEPVGCLATITEWDMPQLGLFHLVTRGTERFRIVEVRNRPNGLVCGHIELLGPEPQAEVDPTCREVLKLIIEKTGAERLPQPIKLDDAAWVAYRLAELLPLEAQLRQRLLEMQNPAERFACLHGVMAKHGLIN